MMKCALVAASVLIFSTSLSECTPVVPEAETPSATLNNIIAQFPYKVTEPVIPGSVVIYWTAGRTKGTYTPICQASEFLNSTDVVPVTTPGPTILLSDSHMLETQIGLNTGSFGVNADGGVQDATGSALRVDGLQYQQISEGSLKERINDANAACRQAVYDAQHGLRPDARGQSLQVMVVRSLAIANLTSNQDGGADVGLSVQVQPFGTTYGGKVFVRYKTSADGSLSGTGIAWRFNGSVLPSYEPQFQPECKSKSGMACTECEFKVNANAFTAMGPALVFSHACRGMQAKKAVRITFDGGIVAKGYPEDEDTWVGLDLSADGLPAAASPKAHFENIHCDAPGCSGKRGNRAVHLELRSTTDAGGRVTVSSNFTHCQVGARDGEYCGVKDGVINVKVE